MAIRVFGVSQQVGSSGVLLEEPSDDAARGIPFTATLTNDQVKASPTTAVDLVPAPGADKILLLVGNPLLVADTAAGAYTNINADATFIIGREGEGDSTTFAAADAVNKPLRFSADNDGDGNFTGGNAANRVVVEGLYRELDVSAFL